MLYYGVYKGIVTNVSDPEYLGRIRAQVPQIFGRQESDWAWPVQPNVADVAVLEVGDPVWISFESGEATRPLWLGTWQKAGSTMPPLTSLTAYQLRSEKGLANGYAALDANARVPTAQLGTGTANAGTYLRGDGSWAPVSGSGDETLVWMGGF